MASDTYATPWNWPDIGVGSSEGKDSAEAARRGLQGDEHPGRRLGACVVA
jgi:hypothetical protein